VHAAGTVLDLLESPDRKAMEKNRPLTCTHYRELCGAGDRDRTGMASLEGWGSAIELRPRNGDQKITVTRRQLTGASRHTGGWLAVYTIGSVDAAGRSVVASAPALGAGDREFESPRPDCLLFHHPSNPDDVNTRPPKAQWRAAPL
jgi:hypothetical protein